MKMEEVPLFDERILCAFIVNSTLFVDNLYASVQLHINIIIYNIIPEKPFNLQQNTIMAAAITPRKKPIQRVLMVLFAQFSPSFINEFNRLVRSRITCVCMCLCVNLHLLSWMSMWIAFENRMYVVLMPQTFEWVPLVDSCCYFRAIIGARHFRQLLLFPHILAECSTKNRKRNHNVKRSHCTMTEQHK